MARTSVCPRPGCGQEESVRHMLWECRAARDLWKEAGPLITSCLPAGEDLTPQLVLYGVGRRPIPSKAFTKLWPTLTCLKEALWSSRNLLVAKNVETTPQAVAMVATEALGWYGRKGASTPGTDCTQIKTLSPRATSGVYVIQPAGVTSPFMVYCEMLADGGWTVFQMRTGAEVLFNKTWAEYEQGFGSLQKDHWLGLSKVFALTKGGRGRSSTMRVNLWDFEGGTAFAEYSDFHLGTEKESYKLNVGAYKGNAGDAIRGKYAGIDQNGFGFSTTDKDNDGCSPCILFGDIAVDKCSFLDGGGWWYSRCGSASLNGDWHPAGEHIGWNSGLHWATWKGRVPYSTRASRMMIKSVWEKLL
ncbi:fibrinogen-like protein 1 [Oncorhynchus clarkii lewisi]|uniref:fibrinogen-like protein 1 n=1 Tax=Oncorhynchus clarkii lewisi TaxID=490388 RepID=UPI0039B899CB